jgi:hypothetical protein
MHFLNHMQTMETLEDLSDKELKDSAESSFEFITDLILKWQEQGVFGKGAKNQLPSCCDIQHSVSD